MTPHEFKEWRKGLFKSRDAAAAALGISASTVRLYEDGVRRDDGRPVEIPQHIGLLCRSISFMGREIKRIEQQIALMESGTMRTHTNGIDTTDESLSRCRANLAELNELLAAPPWASRSE